MTEAVKGLFRRAIAPSWLQESLVSEGHLGRKSGRGIYDYEADAAQLFDLAADPGEKNDLASEQPQVAAGLTLQLSAWVAQNPALAPIPRTK